MRTHPPEEFELIIRFIVRFFIRLPLLLASAFLAAAFAAFAFSRIFDRWQWWSFGEVAGLAAVATIIALPALLSFVIFAWRWHPGMPRQNMTRYVSAAAILASINGFGVVAWLAPDIENIGRASVYFVPIFGITGACTAFVNWKIVNFCKAFAVTYRSESGRYVDI